MIGSHISCHRFEKCIIEHCGFLPQNICKIVDNKHSNPDEVSYDAIIQKLHSFDNITKSGDIILFYFSEHGYLDKKGYHSYEELGNLFCQDIHVQKSRIV
jgi:hypothetical protein